MKELAILVSIALVLLVIATVISNLIRPPLESSPILEAKILHEGLCQNPQCWHRHVAVPCEYLH